ncbi:MAG: hypothetical protein EBR65_01305, partial [Actinobacteria bacterium]|nr:hypothetical protein [Actinomycetota bacterium]
MTCDVDSSPRRTLRLRLRRRPRHRSPHRTPPRTPRRVVEILGLFLEFLVVVGVLNLEFLKVFRVDVVLGHRYSVRSGWGDGRRTASPPLIEQRVPVRGLPEASRRRGVSPRTAAHSRAVRAPVLRWSCGTSPPQWRDDR